MKPWKTADSDATPDEASTSTSASSSSDSLPSSTTGSSSSSSSSSDLELKFANIPKLLGLKVSKKITEGLVRYWGPAIVEHYRDFASSNSTDPLTLLWTAENWRLWLEPEYFVIWLVKRRQLVEYGPRGLAADLMPNMLGEVLGCDPMMFHLPLSSLFGPEDEEPEEVLTGCSWRECQWYSKEPEPEADVRFWACKGCREVRYCGRECHRRYDICMLNFCAGAHT
ncbi:hypothetical protein PENSPDRAFT_293241 [Peniophora sp. CONT]|nr:hypothetical protein PENSPDRAFT_293241 [Peniophora sp. CONT]